MVPEAKLVVSLAGTFPQDLLGLLVPHVGGRRAGSKGNSNLRSADDFHSKILKDVKALELCFDAFERQQNVNPGTSGPSTRSQTCVYDRMHFGKNGRGRLGRRSTPRILEGGSMRTPALNYLS